MYSLCNRSFFLQFEGNRSVKAGLKPKEEAMGSVPNPPHALFVSFYFGPTFALLLHFNNNNNNNKKKTKKKTTAMHAT